MTRKDRQRQRDLRSPQGRAPNWLLVLVAGAITVTALIAGRFA